MLSNKNRPSFSYFGSHETSRKHGSKHSPDDITILRQLMLWQQKLKKSKQWLTFRIISFLRPVFKEYTKLSSRLTFVPAKCFMVLLLLRLITSFLNTTAKSFQNVSNMAHLGNDLRFPNHFVKLRLSFLLSVSNLRKRGNIS